MTTQQPPRTSSNNIVPPRDRPAFKALEEHRKKIRKLHLRQLFAEDPERSEHFTPQALGLYFDYSKNLITGETMRLLLELAEQSGLRHHIDAMFAGDKIFKTLAPGRGDISRTPGREKSAGTTEEGYLYCGPSGAGHFVKMVHNGIEYGLMEAYAEGLNILRRANIGKQGQTVDAQTTPLRNPEHYQYDFNLADVSEVWRRGSVIASWLLDLTAAALFGQQDLSKFSGRVSDSGEGRWAITAAIDEGAPAPVLSAALYQRFTSRGEEDFGNKLLSAMRFGFGGHIEKKS
jgi:6-phosphogluconate dehydrogenase (decarboxylating)